MSQNIKPENLSKFDEMSIEDHNKALDKATQTIQEAILNGNVESKIDEIKSLFWGADILTDEEINDIYEMAQMLNESEGL